MLCSVNSISHWSLTMEYGAKKQSGEEILEIVHFISVNVTGYIMLYNLIR